MSTDSGAETNIGLYTSEQAAEIWKQSIAGKLAASIEERAQREGKEFKVINPGQPFQHIQFGDEVAILVTKLDVDDNGKNYNEWVDSHDYKRYGWWKEELEKAGIKVGVLDPSLMGVAQDAGVENPAEIFDTHTVLRRLGLAEDEPGRLIGTEAIIKRVVSSEVGPDYTARYKSGAIRLVGMTPDAKASKFEDNDIFKQMLDKFKKVTPKLNDELTAFANRPVNISQG